MEILNSKSAISKDEIKKFEQIIEYKLPEDYTQFLLKYNGGIPKKTDFDYEGIDGEESSVVQLFLSLGDQHSENIKQDYNYYLGEGRILEGIVPIAYDPFGNLICLSLVEETYNQIWFWDHELEEEEDNLFFVAKTFNDFIKILYTGE